MKYIDLSHKIADRMPVYPGDINTNLTQDKFLSVDKYNNFKLETGMHTGTHIDSPMHLSENTEFISNFSLESFIGKGFVLDVRNKSIIGMKKEYLQLIPENSIVLFYTGHDLLYGSREYYEDFPCIDMELCEYLISKNVKMIGLDTPSPDKYPFEIHKKFFENGICIIENLTNLEKLNGVNEFEVIALPLKIDSDSSIARVIARVFP